MSSQDWCGVGNKSSLGEHVLPRGSTCTITIPVAVSNGTSLRLASAAPQLGSKLSRAIISGADTTLVFDVTGELTLVDIIVERGKSSHGGCLRVHSDEGTLTRGRASSSFAAAARRQSAAARCARCAPLWCWRGLLPKETALRWAESCDHIWRSSQHRRPLPTTTMTRLPSNTATMNGGGVFLEDEGSTFTATGNGTRDCREQYGRTRRRRDVLS